MQDESSQTFTVMLLAFGVIVALFSPWLTALFAPWAMIALFFVITFSLISFADHKQKNFLSMDATTWLIGGWQLVVLPSLVLALGILGDFPTDIVTMMIVTACAGSLFASPMLAGLLDLDRNRTLNSMVFSTLWTPVSLYVFLSLFYESSVNLDIEVYGYRAIVFLAVPFICLLLYRIMIPVMSAKLLNGIEGGSRWASVIALLIFGVGVVHPVAQQLYSKPLTILLYLFIVTVMSVGMFFLTAIVFHRLGDKEAMTAGVISGFRNVGLCLALVNNMLAPELKLYVGVSMLPIFLAPAIIRLTLVRRQPVGDVVPA